MTNWLTLEACLHYKSKFLNFIELKKWILIHINLYLTHVLKKQRCFQNSKPFLKFSKLTKLKKKKKKNCCTIFFKKKKVYAIVLEEKKLEWG